MIQLTMCTNQEVVVDLKKRISAELLIINGEAIELVDDFRFL